MSLLSSARRLFAKPKSEPNALVLDRYAKLKARYDAAQDSRDNVNHWWNADGLSARAANSPDIRRNLRNRARYEVANNSYASGMVETLANDVIGTGPQLQMLSGNDDADAVVERAFWQWSEASDFANKLRTARKSRTVDGESFFLLFFNPRLDHPIQLDLRCYEAEQIARPTADFSRDNLNDGVIVDQYGNVVEYSLLKEHPGDTGVFPGSFGEAESISFERMVHLFKAWRPGQIRGVPEIMPALPLYALLRRYTLAVISSAEIVANISLLLQTQSGAFDPDDAIQDFDLFDIERGMGMTLPKGWEALQMRAEQPSTTYKMFKREIINEISRCLCMPFNVAAGDSSEYNFASGRLDHKGYFKSINIDRSYIESDALDSHVFRMWWRVGVMQARAGERSPIPPALMEFDTPPPHEWRWDGEDRVDPKEAAADIALVESGLLTEADYHAKRGGKDWEDQQIQLAKELGITVKKLRELKIAKRFATSESVAPTADEEDDDD